MRGQKRPSGERARAVGIAVVTSIAEASRQTGIPEPTIHAWFHSPEFEELRIRNKDQVSEEWWAGVQRGFRVVIDGFDGPEPLQQKATAAAILFDKLAMIRGEATSRTETRTLTEGWADQEKDTLREFIHSLPGDLAGDAPRPGDDASAPSGSRAPAEVR